MADHNGAALEEARRRKERTFPELSGMVVGFAWWSLLQRLEAGGALRPPISWSGWRRPRLLLPLVCCRAGSNKLTSGGGAPCLLARQSARSLLRCWTSVPGLGDIPSVHEVVREARFF